ncbi:MAG: hypothetical protein SGCHY_002839 [Lobulomycetales sp.]
MDSHSHRRFNPLLRSWVLCAPHRAKRPWLGQREGAASPASAPVHDPSCFLCPGNERVSGNSNPDYPSTYVFTNDFQAVKPNQPGLDSACDPPANSPLIKAQFVRGTCEVVCFNPAHNLTIADMDRGKRFLVFFDLSLFYIDQILDVVNEWTSSYKRLSRLDYINHVQIFENKIWSTEHIPEDPRRELDSLAAHKAEHGTCMLCDYVSLEISQDKAGASRIVCQNASFVCVVPYWAVWPYETLVMSRSHLSNLAVLSQDAKRDLADIILRITTRYDNLFSCSFPYSMGIHQDPVFVDDADDDNGIDKSSCGLQHLHIHYYPPLLRSASVKKFIAGFEMVCEPQRDLTAEQSAERLRACSEVHYSREE